MRVAALASDCYLRARKLAVGPGVQVLSPAAGSSHHWSSCRAVIALGMNRFADALFAANETKLTPERLIAEAAKGTRLDAKPFSDPHLVEALGALTSSLREEASLSPLGHLATRWDLKRILSTLLILADTEREDPGILTRPLAPADLHHRPPAQRHDLPARLACGGSPQSRSSHMGGDLSAS